MKKKLLKLIVLIVVFIGAFTFFEFRANQVNEDLTSSMADATLPIVRFSIEGNTIGELHGYTKTMDPSALYDGIICTGDQDTLSVLIENKGTAVKDVSYRIRSLDGERLLAEETLTGYDDRGGLITAKITLPKILAIDTEYILTIELQLEEGTADYYTRLFLSTRCHEKECLEFAREFHENTFREDGADFLRPYMDPATGSSTSLQFVTLASTLDQVMWGDFQGSVSGEPSVTYQEINGTFTGLTLSYLLTSVNEQDETEYYNVREFYRLRYTKDRMYVLNFERTMNQIFRQENVFLSSSDNILLGIRDREVECAASEDGSVIFFVQEGDLWGYDLEENTLTCIFSFRGAEGIDARSNYDRHDIRILRIDENRNVDFAVYGYMNRGNHEGENALIVYRYTAAMHTIEPVVYLPYQISYEMMKQEIERLLYENEENRLYLLHGNQILCVDMTTREVTTIAQELSSDGIRISYDMRYVAWVPADKLLESPSITFMDLSKQKRFEINAEGYDYIRPIAFMDGDFIYGAAYASDKYEDAVGNLICPMASLKIAQIEEDGLQKLKDYTPSGSRIAAVDVDGFTMYLKLIRLENGNAVEAGSDAIVNREAKETMSVDVGVITNGSRQRIVSLATGKQPAQAKLRIFTADVISAAELPLVELPQANRSGYCYVYAKGSLYDAADNLSEAVRTANEQVGIAADYRQKPLWKRAKKNYVNPFSEIGPAEEDMDGDSIRKSLGAMLLYGGTYQAVGDRLQHGMSPGEILSEAFPDKKVLLLTGLTTDEILYYISAGSPVFAMTGADQAIVLCGYTATDIYYYEPSDDEIHSVSYEQMNEWLDAGGYRFLTYVD